jgi:hypothetical protein
VTFSVVGYFYKAAQGKRVDKAEGNLQIEDTEKILAELKESRINQFAERSY